MPALDNKRQEAFCLLIVKGEQPDYICYTAAGYNAKTQESAQAAASRLLNDVKVIQRLQELRGRVAEKVSTELAVTTTDVARHLWQLSYYDVTDVLRIETTGRGRQRRQRVLVKDTSEWPEAMKRTCQGVRINPDGSVQVLLPLRQQPGYKVGEHLGMFQGESAGALPPGGNTNVQYNDNRTQVFVDKPPDETLEQWRARIAKERGIVQNGTSKMINGNGAGKS